MSDRLKSQDSFDSILNQGNVTGNFNGARDVSVCGSVITANRDYISINRTANAEEVDMLDRLAAAACLEAGHEIVQHVDRPKCHEDTRHAVIKDIMSWVNSENPSEKMLWLKGPAGAGKSSIAQTVCIKCEDEEKLLSSFFFSRAAGGPRADGNRLIATIAYHIIQTVPETRKFVLNELSKNPAMLSYTSVAMNVQLTKLVLNPLSLASRTRKSTIPHILVIDGLDEINSTHVQAEIIKLFAVVLASPDVKLKVLISSRPEFEIRTRFKEPFVDQLTKHIVLDSKYKPDEDILTYLTSELSSIKRSHTLSSQLYKEPNWPAQHDIKELVKRSSGQFIYAATVARYIGDKRHNPVERLQQIICIASGQEAQYKELDALYTRILTAAARKAFSFYNFLPVLQMLLFHGQEASPVITDIYNLAEFLKITIDELRLQLIDLHSLVFLPGGDGVLELYHTSFADYLTDASRSGQFFVNEKTSHNYIARCCLQNILDSLSELTGLNDSVKVALESDYSVTYSLEFYLVHVAKSDFDDDLLSEFEKQNQYVRQSIMNQIFMQMIMLSHRGEQMIDIYQILEYYFLNDNNFVRPRTDKLIALCGLMAKAVDAFALTHLHRSEWFHLQQIFKLANAHKSNGFEDERLHIYDCWIGAVLNDPDRGKQFYMSNERCQYIWRRMWKILRDPTFQKDSLGRILVECKETDLAILFRYLLNIIKPCSSFNMFLKEFKDIFDLSYYVKCHPDWQYSQWLSLQEAIAAYDEECNSLGTINIEHWFNCDVYRAKESGDTPLTEGIQVPWMIKEENTDEEYITYSSEIQEDTDSTGYTQKHEQLGSYIGQNQRRSGIQFATTAEVIHMEPQTESTANVNWQTSLPTPFFVPGFSIPAMLSLNIQQLSMLTQRIGHLSGLVHVPVEVKIPINLRVEHASSTATPTSDHCSNNTGRYALDGFESMPCVEDIDCRTQSQVLHSGSPVQNNFVIPPYLEDIYEIPDNEVVGHEEGCHTITADTVGIGDNELGMPIQYRERDNPCIRQGFVSPPEFTESYSTSCIPGTGLSAESHFWHGTHQSDQNYGTTTLYENLDDMPGTDSPTSWHSTTSCLPDSPECPRIIRCQTSENASPSGLLDIDMVFNGDFTGTFSAHQRFQ